MDTQAVMGRNEVSANEAPIKSYKKVVLGKLLIKTWDSMTGREIELVFAGDPNKGDEAVFDVFNDKERVYFERQNKKHFDKGMLIPYTRPEVTEVVRSYEQYTDDELRELVNAKFLSLTSTLNKITSVAVLFRMISLATEMDKSDKITGAIQKRISELQAEEFAPKKPAPVLDTEE